MAPAKQQHYYTGELNPFWIFVTASVMSVRRRFNHKPCVVPKPLQKFERDFCIPKRRNNESKVNK